MKTARVRIVGQVKAPFGEGEEVNGKYLFNLLSQLDQLHD